MTVSSLEIATAISKISLALLSFFLKTIFFAKISSIDSILISKLNMFFEESISRLEELESAKISTLILLAAITPI